MCLIRSRYFTRGSQEPTPTATEAAGSSSQAKLAPVAGLHIEEVECKTSRGPDVSKSAAPSAWTTDSYEVAEVTRQRRELIALCGVLVTTGVYGCARSCRSGGTS